jgi:hypothetical protein
VLFQVHRMNLEMHSEGFAAAGECTIPASSEALDLPETAAVLELLLQYMYRQPQPDLTQVKFVDLSDLAEAAEKYQVYPAMEICKVMME